MPNNNDPIPDGATVQDGATTYVCGASRAPIYWWELLSGDPASTPHSRTLDALWRAEQRIKELDDENADLCRRLDSADSDAKDYEGEIADLRQELRDLQERGA